MPPPLPAGEAVVRSNPSSSRVRQANAIKLSPTLSRLHRFGPSRQSEEGSLSKSNNSGRYLSASPTPKSKLANRLEELSRSGRNLQNCRSKTARLSSRRLTKQYSFDGDCCTSPSRLSNGKEITSEIVNPARYSEKQTLSPTGYQSRRRWRSGEHRLRISAENNSSDEGLHMEVPDDNSISSTNLDQTNSQFEKSSDSPLNPHWTKARERRISRGSIPKSASDSVITCPLSKSSAFLNHIRKPGWTGLICQIPVSVYNTLSGFEIYVEYDETEILRTVKEHLTKR